MAEKTTVNVGRVQGAGIYKSKAEAEEGTFYFENLTPSEILPKTGDSVITPSGEIWTVTERGTECVICEYTGDTICGPTGATPDIEVTATVDESTGTPQVTVTKSGTAESPEFTLAFSGLKGEREDASNYYTKSETDELVSGEAEERQKADAEETRNRELMDSYLAGRIDSVDVTTYATKDELQSVNSNLKSGIDTISGTISDYAEVDSLARSALQQADIAKMTASDVDLLF